MRSRLLSGWLVFAIALLFSNNGALAASDEVTLEVQLVWGTNDAKPPADSKSKLTPIGPKLDAKLKKSPFKWEHYFEVHRERFTLKVGEEKTASISKSCEVKVKYLGDSQVSFQLYGKGKLTSSVTQA